MSGLRSRLRAVYHALLRDPTPALEQLRHSVDVLSARVDAMEAAAPPSSPAIYLGDREAVVTTTWGRRIIVRTDDYIVSPGLLATGCYEPELTTLMPRLLSPGGTMVDVGANVGYYSVLASSVVGADGFVVAFEPHPDLARLTAVNLVINHMRASCHVERSAAHDEAAELEFFVRGRFGANSSLGPVTDGELDELGDTQRTITVPAVEIDAVLAELDRTAAVDLMKIDVEGAEVGALRGARRTISESRPRIVLEWAPAQQRQAGHTPAELVDHLDGLDLDMAVIEAPTGDLTPISGTALLEIPYTNLLLVPSGAPLTLR